MLNHNITHWPCPVPDALDPATVDWLLLRKQRRTLDQLIQYGGGELSPEALEHLEGVLNLLACLADIYPQSACRP
jgi:hypothetical protein